MRIEIADGAVHLAHDHHALERRALAAQARAHVGNLLAHGGRRRGLTVRARQHADGGMLDGERIEQPADGLERGQQHARARRLQHECVRQIVDVFRSRAEVHPFQLSGTCTQRLKSGANPILDRLDVVIGAQFERLDRRDIGACGIGGEFLQPRPGRERQARHRGGGRAPA